MFKLVDKNSTNEHWATVDQRVINYTEIQLLDVLLDQVRGGINAGSGIRIMPSQLHLVEKALFEAKASRNTKLKELMRNASERTAETSGV